MGLGVAAPKMSDDTPSAWPETQQQTTVCSALHVFAIPKEPDDTATTLRKLSTSQSTVRP